MLRLRQFAVVAVCGSVLSIGGLVGCTHERPNSLGGNAILAVSGNKTLTYTAPSDGVITVNDVRSEDVIYSGRVKKGESVVVDVDDSRINVGGRVVAQKRLNRIHEHRIYFEPAAETMESSSSVTQTTRTETKRSEGQGQ